MGEIDPMEHPELRQLKAEVERGILDVLDAQRVLRSIRADLLDARYQLQAARIQLEYLAGRYDDPAAP
jgi:cobalt-zinc-cadmium efflux system outer membrane protein